MEDSSFKVKVTAEGIPEARAQLEALGATLTSLTIKKNGDVEASGRVGAAQDQLTQSTNQNAEATDKAAKAHESYYLHIAKTTIQSALVNKAFIGLTDAMGEAVKQVDLMQNFPAAMGALGLSTKDAVTALGVLRQYAQQAGISLTDATQTVTRFAEVTKDVKAATVEFIGVKNALIAGAAPAEQQKNAMEQLTQAYSRGRPQLMEWRSLMTAMPAQLTLVAQAMKYPNAQALGEALTKGKISMQEFMTELTKLSTNGGPIAKNTAVHMQGIEYATNVMKATLTNAIAAIYTAIGRSNIIGFFQTLTQVIYAASQGIVFFINNAINMFNIISKFVGGPQIKGMSKDLGDGAAAGAAGASDMADNLDNAANSADKITKSLASFDKMNVLPEKKSKDSGDTGQNGLDPATAKALDSAFDSLAFKLQAASTWAKILAGVLGAFAANGLIKKLFGVNPLKELITDIGKAAFGADGLGSKLANAAKDFGKGLTGFGATEDGEMMGSAEALGLRMAKGVRKGFMSLAGFLGDTVMLAFGGILTALEFVGTLVALTFLSAAEVAALPFEAIVAIGAIVVAAIVALIWLIWDNWNTIWNFIKRLFDDVVGAIVIAWQSLYAIFKGPVEWIWHFVEGIVVLIVALFSWLILGIIKLWIDGWLLIFNMLATVATWIYDNVIVPIGRFFVGLWDGVTKAVIAAWQWIYANVLGPIISWISMNVILPILLGFEGLWHGTSGFFSNIFRDIVTFLSPIGSWIYTNVIAPVAGFFSGLWDGVKHGVNDMISGIKTILGGLADIVKAPINLVVDGWNKLIGTLNKVKIPGTNVSPHFDPLPRLAMGGVVTQPTMALVGESGSEAIMPLENNTGWIDTLASKINAKSGNSQSSQPVQLIVQIGEDKVASKVIDLINEKTNMSGRNVIYV